MGERPLSDGRVRLPPVRPKPLPTHALGTPSQPQRRPPTNVAPVTRLGTPLIPRAGAADGRPLGGQSRQMGMRNLFHRRGTFFLDGGKCVVLLGNRFGQGRGTRRRPGGRHVALTATGSGRWRRTRQGAELRATGRLFWFWMRNAGLAAYSCGHLASCPVTLSRSMTPPRPATCFTLRSVSSGTTWLKMSTSSFRNSNSPPS